MDDLMRADGALLSLNREEAKQEILACNAITQPFGLMLSGESAAELVRCRVEALRDAGRVEFGGGILPKLIRTFCDSPYMEQETYEETLADLQEMFYYYKTESCDRYTDDELLELMVSVFNGRAQGSTAYLSGTSLEALARYVREGYDPTDAERAGDLF